MNTLFLLTGLVIVCSVICDTQARTMAKRLKNDSMTTSTDDLETDLKSTLLNGSIPLPFLNFESNLEDTMAVGKRQYDQVQNQDIHHHWHCNTTITWKDLGWLHYPRFVREVMCAAESCMHGFYMCRPQIYQVRVLTVRGENEDEEVTVPVALRHNWKFTEVEVSVGCLCAT